MNRGYHGARGAAPNDGIFIEAARTPGHPLNKLARRQGIPPEEICDFLLAERDYYKSQGMESPWARIVNETGQAYEWNERVQASGGGGGHGERGDRRRRQQTFPHEAEAWDRYKRELADYNRELDGFHREVDKYHREMDQLSHNLDRFATLQQQQGRRGRPQPSETTGSEKDPDEAMEMESRQQQARAERRYQAEMIAEQKQMEQMEQMAAMGGMHGTGGMGGGRDPRMARGGWY
ncbi:MAG: hypothetical protein LQ339_000692 [Xanthoria mediterranea]|nr:MAG: hypothetical protein LQ339_000692 [Xanthoria mediterranea]